VQVHNTDCGGEMQWVSKSDQGNSDCSKGSQD
jgi:hypothetical protein